MRARTLRSVVRRSVVAVGLLGVVGVGAGCGADNVAACKEYVQARNDAYEACEMRDRMINADETCPDTLNDGIDCTDYYTRLADSFECTAGEVTWDASGSCT